MNVFRRSRPRLSVVVIVYNMEREAPRTLRSLAPGFQHTIEAEDYEVIVVDNGSPEPIDAGLVSGIAPNFRYVYLDNASPSPVHAINHGVAMSRGDLVGIWIDGARIASPGLLQRALEASRIFEKPVVATLGFHLGSKPQQVSITEGYDESAEDDLLESVSWPCSDYRLFQIAALGGSSRRGYFHAPAESNALFLKREHFDILGGYETRFDDAGGGLANHDFFKRAVETDNARLVVLLGEGTFHQVHGGISTNVPNETNERNLQRWLEGYREIRGAEWQQPEVTAYLYGTVRPELQVHMQTSMELLDQN